MARKRKTQKQWLQMIRMEGNPCLATRCKPISDPVLEQEIINDMVAVLGYTKTGVGLAANQIGHLHRIIVFKPNKNIPGFFVMINPEIVGRSNELTNRPEGCLSYSGITKNITRHELIEVDFKTERGAMCTSKFHGMNARIVQHEVDHLDGFCLVGAK